MIRENTQALRKYSQNETHDSPNYKNLTSCTSGIILLIHKMIAHEKLFPPNTIVQTENYDYFKNDQNIYGAIANGIFAIIESLSTTPYKFESVRLILLDIYPSSREETSPFLLALQSRLDILLKEKILENLTKLYYPAVTASLIYSFSLCEPDKTNISIHKILLNELKKHYLPMYRFNKEIALHMLPDDTVVDIKAKKLVRKHPLRWLRNRRTEELKLND